MKGGFPPETEIRGECLEKWESGGKGMGALLQFLWRPAVHRDPVEVEIFWQNP
jgi:hypothetical protein